MNLERFDREFYIARHKSLHTYACEEKVGGSDVWTFTKDPLVAIHADTKRALAVRLGPHAKQFEAVVVRVTVEVNKTSNGTPSALEEYLLEEEDT